LNQFRQGNFVHQLVRNKTTNLFVCLWHKPECTQLISKFFITQPKLVTVGLFIGFELSSSCYIKLCTFSTRKGKFHEPKSHNFRMLLVEVIVMYDFCLLLFACFTILHDS